MISLLEKVTWSTLMNKTNRVKLFSTGLLVSVFMGLLSALALNSAQAQMPRRGGFFNQSNDAVEANVTYEKWTDQKRQRTLPIKIYRPTDVKKYAAPYPVLIFSHGLGGSVEAAPYLGKALSDAGYICFFVQHPGSDDSIWRSHLTEGKAGIMANLKKQASPQNLVGRDEDIKFVIDELTRRNQVATDLLKNTLDLSKIAMSGHSFGAGTTLAIAGQSYGAGGKNAAPGIDDRVKAALYLCPPVNTQRLVRGETYSRIKIPGILFTGTEDNSPIGDTKAEDRRLPFDEIKAPPQYLVIFNGANHATFGGGMGRGPTRRGTANDPQFQAMTAAVSVQFLNAALKNDPAAWQWLDGHGATDYLGKIARFERK
jgi:pimeloyl-ACP methyl ester carboxylesterase